MENKKVVVIGYSGAGLEAISQALSNHGCTVVEAGTRLSKAAEDLCITLKDLNVSFEDLKKPLPQPKSKYHK